jgi:hypothetical protein
MIVACCLFPMLAPADEGSPIAVNPVGRPDALTKGNAIRYFLWHDADGWHLRTDSNGKPHKFKGTITVVGGKVTEISDFEDLEAGRPRRKRDLGHLNEAENQVTFSFTTSVARDGFDFTVDGGAREIRFDLTIDGKPAPRRILIGAESQPAPTEDLVLPAHPE